MTSKLFLAAAAAVTFATPALASDGLRFYAGPIAGYDHVTLSAAGAGSGSGDGVVYGGTAGVDAKVSYNGTFGVETEFTDSSVSASATSVLVAGDRARVSAGRDLYAGVRGAYFVAPRVILYAKVGYTNARIDALYDNGAGTVRRGHIDRGGLRFGPGLELVINRNFGFRAEYRRSEYKSFDTGFGFGIKAHRDQLVAGLVAGF